jgi:hypothetical protein
MDTPMRKMYADAAVAFTAIGAPGPDYGATDSTENRKATHPGDTAGGQESAEWAQADKAQEMEETLAVRNTEDLSAGDTSSPEEGHKQAAELTYQAKTMGEAEKQVEPCPTRRERVGSFSWAQNVEEEALDTMGYTNGRKQWRTSTFLRNRWVKGRKLTPLRQVAVPNARKRSK